MTYKHHLEQLHQEAVKKANAYIDVVRKQGQVNTPEYRRAEGEWEAAERAYMAFMRMIGIAGINPNDYYPPLPHKTDDYSGIQA